MTRFSVVTSLYYSADFVREFHARTTACLQVLGGAYEVIYVNDGSPDDSLARAVQLQSDDPHVIVVDLSRNFGHHRALMVGLEQAKGDMIFLIDADLEEEPELLATFYEVYKETNADAVYGVQKSRKGRAFERLSGAVFYSLFNILTGLAAPKDTLIARLMTRRYVDALVAHRERVIDLAGLHAIAGFRQVPVPVHKSSKPETTYTLRRKLALAFRSIVSFSYQPLLLIFLLGTAISGFAVAVIIFFFVSYMRFGIVPSGYTSLILSLWFLGGLTIFSIGIVALYVAIIFLEVKARPTHIIRQVYRAESSS